MKITLKPTNHPPVKVSTPYGSRTSASDLLIYIRKTEAEMRNKAWARAKFAAEKQSRAANQDVPQIGTRPASPEIPGPSIKG